MDSTISSLPLKVETIDKRIQFGFVVSIKDKLYTLFWNKCEQMFQINIAKFESKEV